MRAYDHAATPLDAALIRRARQAYFGSISYVDDKLGELLDVLEKTGMREDTIIVFTSDHGDMLGERGLWFKMCFYEAAARVPLLISGPGIAPRRIDRPASTLDLLPTLADLIGADIAALGDSLDGESLVPLIRGSGDRGPVPMEYVAEGSAAPLVALRDGRWKIVVCDLDPPQLFDLETDPHERRNLADDPAYAGELRRLLAEVHGRWDLASFDRAVRASQQRRHFVYDALRQGRYQAWDYQPVRDASQRYMRNHMDLNLVEVAQRFPRGLSGND